MTASPGTLSAGEAMDRMYRFTRHVYDASRKYYLFGRDRLIADLRPEAHGAVLEVGCGTARNLIAVARRYPQVRACGFDVSAAMLDTARASVHRAGLAERIHLAQADATAFHPQLFGIEAFDRVFISFALSMIPDARAAVEAALSAVKPGGELHIVDFGQLQGYPAPVRRALFAWLRAFHVVPRADLESLLSAAAAERGGRLVYRRLYGGYADLAVVTLPGGKAS